MPQTSSRWVFCLCAVLLLCGQTELLAQDAPGKYVPPTVLSLVVSTKDPILLEQALQRLHAVSRTRKVAIGSVLIVGDYSRTTPIPEEEADRMEAPSEYERNLLAFGPSYRLLAEAGVPQPSRVPADRVLKRLELNASPTWIVRYRGNDYIFEGWSDPGQLFTQRGEFLRAEE